MKRMVWDDDVGGFVEQEANEPPTGNQNYEEAPLADWEKELLVGGGDSIPPQHREEYQKRLPSEEARQALIAKLLEMSKRHGYAHMAVLLRALMWRKLAKSQMWKDSNDAWRRSYLIRLEQGSDIHRQNASHIS